MKQKTPEKLTETDALKTYRYLRIGMVLATFLLGAAILIERSKVDCWQTSISAYYYTPVRAILVGSLFAVGFALIVIKGRTTWEDVCLNFAGMLAPVVAIVPTTDVGTCWSVVPRPLPKEGGTLAPWVVANIANNFRALLIAGLIGFVIAVAVAIRLNRSRRATGEPAPTASLVVTGSALAVGWFLIEYWKGFSTGIHGPAALLMFVFLVGAVVGKAHEHKGSSTRYLRVYSAVALVMVVGGILIAVFHIGNAHAVAVLEAFEIVLFATFWVVQTVERWNEEVSAPR